MSGKSKPGVSLNCLAIVDGPGWPAGRLVYWNASGDWSDSLAGATRFTAAERPLLGSLVAGGAVSLPCDHIKALGLDMPSFAALASPVQQPGLSQAFVSISWLRDEFVTLLRIAHDTLAASSALLTATWRLSPECCKGILPDGENSDGVNCLLMRGVGQVPYLCFDVYGPEGGHWRTPLVPMSEVQTSVSRGWGRVGSLDIRQHFGFIRQHQPVLNSHHVGGPPTQYQPINPSR